MIINFFLISQMLHLKWMHILNIKFVLKIINCHIIIDISQNVFDHELSGPISPHSSLTPWWTTIWWAPLQTVMLGKNSRGFTSYPNYNCIFFVSSAIICEPTDLVGDSFDTTPIKPKHIFSFSACVQQMNHRMQGRCRVAEFQSHRNVQDNSQQDEQVVPKRLPLCWRSLIRATPTETEKLTGNTPQMFLVCTKYKNVWNTGDTHSKESD